MCEAVKKYRAHVANGEMKEERGGGGTLGRRKVLQANCGTFSYIVCQQAQCCVGRLCASRYSLCGKL